MTSADNEIKVVLQDCAQRHHGELTTTWKERTMSTLLQHIKLYERHRQWLLELRPDYNDDDEDLERGLQRLGRQVSNVVSSFLQTAGQQLESLATSHNGPHPNPDAWGSLGARDRMLTPRSHQLAVLHRVEATMSAAGDTSNPPLSVTGLASASADARLVFVFVPMTQIASSFEPAYSLVDLTSRVFIPQPPRSRLRQRPTTLERDTQTTGRPSFGEGGTKEEAEASESLEELIPVLEEAPPREQTETGTQTVKTLTHGTTQTCKELLPPEIVYAETGVGSHFAILPPEPEMGVGSEDALWEAPHIVTADASVGSQHVFPPTPPVMVGRGVGESKVDPDRKPPGTKRKTDSIHVTNVSTSSKSTVVETYEIEYQREEVPHIPPMVDEARGLRAAHISRSYTITPGGKRVNVMEVYSSDSETKMSSKSVSTNRCTSPSSRASTPPAKGKKSKSCKKANKSNSRSASINRDRLAINQSIRSRATDYRSTVRSKERATRESDDVSNSHSRSISLASGRANSISPYDDISKECLIGKLLLSVHSQKDGARSPTYTLSDSAQFDDDTIHEWPDDGRKSSLPQGQSWLKPTPTARKPNTIKPNTVKPRTSDGRVSPRKPRDNCMDVITSKIRETDNETDKEVEHTLCNMKMSSGVFFPRTSPLEEMKVQTDESASRAKVEKRKTALTRSLSPVESPPQRHVEKTTAISAHEELRYVSVDDPGSTRKAPIRTDPERREHHQKKNFSDRNFENSTTMWSDVIEELSEVLEQTTETVREVSPSFTDPNVTNRRAVLKQTRDRASRFSSQFGESVKQFIAHSEVTKSVEQYKIITSEPPVQVEIHALERTFVDDKGTDETTRHSTPSSPVGASPPQIAKSKSRPPSVSPAPDPLCPRQRSAPATAGRVAEEKQESQEEPTSASASASPKPKSRKKSASPPASPSARSPPTMSPEAKTREKESPRRLKTPVTARRQGVRADGTTVVSPDQGKHEDEVSEQLMALHGADISSYQAAVDSLVPPSLSLSSSLNPQSEASAETAVGSSEVSTQQPGTRSPEAAPRQRRRSPSSARSADGSVKSPSSRESSSRCDRSPSPTKRHSPQHRGGSSTSPSPQRSAVSSVSPAPSARSPVVESVASARSSPRHSVKSLTPPAVSTQLGGKSVVSSSLSPRSSPQHSAKSSPSPSLHSSPQESIRSSLSPSPEYSVKSLASGSLSPPSSPQHSGKSSPSPSTQRLSVTPESPKRSPRQSPKIVTARSQTPHFSPVRSVTPESPQQSPKNAAALSPSPRSSPVETVTLDSPKPSPQPSPKNVAVLSRSPRSPPVQAVTLKSPKLSPQQSPTYVATRSPALLSSQAQTPSQADDTKSGTTRSPSLERGVSAMQSPSPRMPRSSPPQGATSVTPQSKSPVPSPERGQTAMRSPSPRMPRSSPTQEAMSVTLQSKSPVLSPELGMTARRSPSPRMPRSSPPQDVTPGTPQSKSPVQSPERGLTATRSLSPRTPRLSPPQDSKPVTPQSKSPVPSPERGEPATRSPSPRVPRPSPPHDGESVTQQSKSPVPSPELGVIATRSPSPRMPRPSPPQDVTPVTPQSKSPVQSPDRGMTAMRSSSPRVPRSSPPQDGTLVTPQSNSPVLSPELGMTARRSPSPRMPRSSPPQEAMSVTPQSKSPVLSPERGLTARRSPSPRMPRSSPPQEAMSVTPQSKSPSPSPERGLTATRSSSPRMPRGSPPQDVASVALQSPLSMISVATRSPSPHAFPLQDVKPAAARSPSPSPEYTVKSLTTRSPPPSQDMKQSRSPPSPPEKSLATLSLPSQDIQQSQSLSQGTKPVVTKSPPLSPGRSLATKSPLPPQVTATVTPKSPTPSPAKVGSAVSPFLPVVSPRQGPDSVTSTRRTSPSPTVDAGVQTPPEFEHDVDKRPPSTSRRFSPKRPPGETKAAAVSPAGSPRLRPSSSPLSGLGSPRRQPSVSSANPSPLCLSPRSPPKLPVKYAVENKISKKLLETWPMTSPPRPKRKVSPSPSPKPPSPEALAALGAHAKRCAACAERYQLTHLLASETETKKKVSKTSVRCSSRRSQSTTPPPLKLSLQSSTTSPSARTPTPPNSAPATQVNRSATRLSPLSPGKGQKKQTKSPTKKSRRTRSPVKSVSQSVTSQSQPDEMSPQDPLVVSPMTPIESSPFNESPEQTPDQGERPSSQISEASPRQALVSTSPTASAPQTAQGEKMTSGASVMSESSPSTLPFTPPALTSPTESLSVSIPSPVRSAGVSSPRPEACEDAVAQSPVKATSPKSSVSPPPEQVKPSTDVELSSEGAEKEVEAAESSSGTTQQPSPPKILSLQHLGPEMGNELTVRITARSKSASPTRRASPRASPQTGLKETVVATAVAATVITTLAKDLELSQTGCDDEQEKVPSKESSVDTGEPTVHSPEDQRPRTGEVPPVAVASLISVESTEETTPPPLRNSSLTQEPVNADLYKMAFISPSLSSNSGDSLLATPVDPADTEKETADSRVLSQYPLDPPKLTECSGMVVSPGTTPIAKPRGLAVTVLKEEEELSTDTSVGTLETSEHEVPWKEQSSQPPVFQNQTDLSSTTPQPTTGRTEDARRYSPPPFVASPGRRKRPASHQQPVSPALKSTGHKTSPFETSDTAPANTSTSEDAFSSQASLIRGPAAEKTSSGSVRSMGYSMSQKSPTFEKESMTLTTESSATSQEARPEPHPAPAVSSADRGSSRQFRPPSPGSELSMTSTFFGTSPPSSCRSASPKGSFKHQPAVRVSPVKPLTDPPEAQRRKSPGRSPKASLIGKTFSGATVSELKVLLEKQRKSTKERGSETPRPVTDKANDLIKTSTEPPKTSFLRMLVNDDETGAERHEKHGRSHDGENKLNIGNANNTAFERVNKNTGGLPLPLEHVTTSVYQKRVNVDGQPPSSKVTITQKKVRYTAEPVGANLEPAPGEQSPPKILTLPPSSHKSLPQPTPIVPVTTGRAAQPSPGFTSVQRTRSEEEEQALRQPAPPSFEGQEMPGEAKVIGTSPRHSGHPSPHKQVIMDMLAFGHNPKAYVPPSPQRHPGGRSPGRSPQMYPNVRGGVNSLPPQVIPSPPSSRAESAGISMTTPEERARILAATRNKKRLSPRPGSAPYPTGVRDQTDRHPAREKRYPGREQPSRQPVAEVYYPSSGEDRWSTEALYPVSDQDQVVRQPVLGTYYPGSDKDAGVRQPVVGDHSLLGRREPSPAHARKMDILSRPPRFPMLNAHSSGDSSEDFSDFFAKYLDETQKRISPPRSPKKHLTSPARSPRSARSPQRVKTASPSPQSSKRRPPDPYERLRRAFEKRQRNLTQIVKLPDISENNLAGSSRRSESEGRRVTPTTSPGWSPYPSNVVVYPGMNPHPQPFGHQLHAYRHRQGLIGDSSELLASVRSPPYPQPVNAPYSDVARDRSRRKQGRRVSWNDDHNRLTERQRLVESKNQNAAGTSESASTAVESEGFERNECHHNSDGQLPGSGGNVGRGDWSGGQPSKGISPRAEFSPSHYSARARSKEPRMTEELQESAVEQKIKKPNIEASQYVQNTRRLVKHFNALGGGGGGGEGTVSDVEFSQRRTQTKQCTVRQNETTTHASTEQMQRRHFRHSQDLTLDTQEQRMQKEYTFQDRRQRVSMLEERQQSQEYILKKSPRTALFSEQRVAPNATSTTSQSSDGPYAVQAKRADNNQNRAWSSSESLSDVEQPGENQMEESPVKGNPLSLSEELRNAGWSPGGLPSKEPPAQGDQVVSGNVRTVEFEEWTDEEGSLPCDCLPGNHLHDVNESANSSSRLGKDNGSSCEDECVNWDSRFYTPKDITGDTAIGAGSDETSRHHHVKMSTKTWRRKRVVRREQDEEDGNVQYYSLEAHDDLRGGCTDSHNGSRHGTTPRRRRRHRNDDNDNINNSGNDNPGNTPYKTIPNDTAVEYPLPHKVTDDPCKGEVAGAIGGTSPHESTRRHGSLGALSSYPRTKPTMLRKRRSFGRSYLSRIMSRRQGDDSDGHGSGAVGHQKPSCRTKSEDYTERPHASNTNRRGGLDICHECGPVPGDSRASEFLPAQKGLYAQAAYDRASGLVYFNTHTDGECACTVVDVNATRGLHDRRFIPRAFTEETVRYEDQNDENDNFSQSSSQAEHEERCERDEDRTDSISSYEVGEVWGSSQQSSQSSVPSAYSDDVHCKLHEEAYNPERGDGDVDRGFYKEREALTKGACVMDEKGRQKEASSYSTAESQACEPSETCPPDENFSRATYTASPVSGKSSANARGPSTFTVTESMVQAYGYNPLTVSPFTARGYPRLAHDESNLDHVTVPFVKRKALIFLRSDKQEFVEVGRGTYGCVYLAQATTRRGTAKVVVKDFFTDSTTWELIVHEARMLSYLQDTGVIPHFYGLLKRRSLGDDYSLIMQYFGQGKTLHTALVNKEDLPALIWQDVAWQLARGLLLIHERHVLLNDLKGDNVLIDMRRERKVIKYIDLGMATYRKGLNFHLPEDQMSKFNFLAPEVRAGAFTSPMSDVYSLGYLLDQINRLAKLQALHETSQKCMDDLPADRPHLPLVVEALQIQSDVLADAAAAEAMN